MSADGLDELRIQRAHREIRTALARYCRGVDRIDAELIRSVYHPDGYDDHIIFRGDVDSFVAWVCEVALPAYSWSMHNLGTCLIEVDRDSAAVETYAVCYHGVPRPDGLEEMYTVAVRYLDRFESRSGGPWLIAHRHVIAEWRRTEPIDPRRDGERRGARDGSDPAYGLSR